MCNNQSHLFNFYLLQKQFMHIFNYNRKFAAELGKYIQRNTNS